MKGILFSDSKTITDKYILDIEKLLKASKTGLTNNCVKGVLVRDIKTVPNVYILVIEKF